MAIRPGKRNIGRRVATCLIRATKLRHPATTPAWRGDRYPHVLRSRTTAESQRRARPPLVCRADPILELLQALVVQVAPPTVTVIWAPGSSPLR